jgi:hypothetical protein
MESINGPCAASVRTSKPVRNSFVITSVTAFAMVGYFVAFWLASLIVPDAADFYRQGGSIPTGRLDSFYSLWGLGICAAACVGAIVGRGFYEAWLQKRQ